MSAPNVGCGRCSRCSFVARMPMSRGARLIASHDGFSSGSRTRHRRTRRGRTPAEIARIEGRRGRRADDPSPHPPIRWRSGAPRSRSRAAPGSSPRARRRDRWTRSHSPTLISPASASRAPRSACWGQSVLRSICSSNRRRRQQTRVANVRPPSYCYVCQIHNMFMGGRYD